MAPFRDKQRRVHEGLSRHSENEEIEVLKKTCVSAGLVAAVAGALLLGSSSTASAGWGGGHSSHHSKSHNKNKNKITIWINVRNNNFNANRHEGDRERDRGGEVERPIILPAPQTLPLTPIVG